MQATRHTSIATLIIAYAMMTIAAMPVSAQGAAEVWLDRIVEKLQNKGVEITFRIDEEYTHTSGKLLMEGEKFAYAVDGMKIWCDGTTQWLLQTGGEYSELYIGILTPEERQAINPYLLLSNYKEHFTITEETERNNKGKYAHKVRLQANDPSAAVKDIDLYITKDSTLAAIVFATANGQSSQIEVHSMRSGLTFPKDTFTYQPEAYPADEVIDMR